MYYFKIIQLIKLLGEFLTLFLSQSSPSILECANMNFQKSGVKYYLRKIWPFLSGDSMPSLKAK